MTPKELVDHLNAYSIQYNLDAWDLSRKGSAADMNLARYFQGKSDAFLIAANWVADHLGVTA